MNIFSKLIVYLITFTVSTSALLANENKISAYLVGSYISVDTAKKKLSSAGYDIVASYVPVDKGTTILFTNKIL